MIYRNIGESTLQDATGATITLNQLGQKVDLSDDQIAQYRANERDSSPRPALLSEKEFESIGFTDQEISDFPSLASQVSAPEDMQGKLTKARELFIGLGPKENPDHA